MVKHTRFEDIPRFITFGHWECDFRPNEVIEFVEKHQVDMNPDFQRGHVWTEAQQIAWVEFYLRGGKTGRVLYFNCPSWQKSNHNYDEFVIVDGKQRYEALRRFVQDEIEVFGSRYSEFTDCVRVHHSIKININDLPTRRDVLRWYLEMNSGGTPHAQSELSRVKQLLEAEKGG